MNWHGLMALLHGRWRPDWLGHTKHGRLLLHGIDGQLGSEEGLWNRFAKKTCTGRVQIFCLLPPTSINGRTNSYTTDLLQFISPPSRVDFAYFIGGSGSASPLSFWACPPGAHNSTLWSGRLELVGKAVATPTKVWASKHARASGRAGERARAHSFTCPGQVGFGGQETDRQPPTLVQPTTACTGWL